MNRSLAGAARQTITHFVSPRRPLFWILVVLIVYTLTGFFLAPRLVQRVAVNAMAETNRVLTLGEVRVNPFLLTLRINKAELKDIDGAALVSFGDLLVNFQLSSLFRWAWTFKEFRLDDLLVNFEQFPSGDGRIRRLFRDLAPTDEPPEQAAAEGEPLPRILVFDLQLNGTNIEYAEKDATGAFQTSLGPINIAIDHLSTLPDASGGQQVEITTENGGRIAWSGSLQLAPILSEGSLTLSSNHLEEAMRYLSRGAPYRLAIGAIEARLDYRLEQRGTDLSIRTEDLDATILDASATLNDEEKPLLTVPELRISGGGLRYPEMLFEIGSLELSGLTLEVVAEADGSLNTDRLAQDGDPAAEQAAEQAPEAPGTAEPEWRVTVGTFGIDGGAVSYLDQATEPAAEILLQQLALSAKAVDSTPATRFPVVTTFNFGSGGSVRFDGHAEVLPELSADGALTVTDLELGMIQPYVNGIARVNVDSGTLDLDGQAGVGPGEPARYAGAVTMRAFGLTDTRARERLAGWKTLHLDRAEFSLGQNSLKTSELVLASPYGRVVIAEDLTTNLDELMVEDGSAGAGNPDQAPSSSGDTTDASSAAAATEPSEPMAVTVDGFRITDAALDFSDLSLPLPFAAAIRAMDGTISTLSTESEEPARIDLEGQVDEFGSASIGGSLNAWDPERFTDVQMAFRNIDITRMTPYSVEFAGWEIADGRMDLDLDYRIDQGQLLGENKIVIREMQVGDKVEDPEAGSLPLKLAVALLKDSQGVIDVDLPVSGDVNDPEFHIGGVVWKAVVNLITGIVTAPFKLLGGLVGADSEDFGTLSFAAGSAELSPPDREKMVNLAAAMTQRPELLLEIGGVYAEEADGLALKVAAVDARIAERMATSGQSGEQLSGNLRRQALERLFTETFPGETLESVQAGYLRTPDGAAADDGAEAPQPQLDETAYAEGLRQRLVEAEPVTEDELRVLAESRAQTIANALQEGAGATPLRVARGETVEVAAEEGEAIKLELKVTAEDLPAGADTAAAEGP